MLEVKVTIEAKGLRDALNSLAMALSKGTVSMTSQIVTPSQQTDTPVFVPQVVPNEPNTAAQNVQTTQVPVATATPSYTREDIAKAGAYLADTDKRADLIALLQKFGARSVKDLQPEQFGAFAAELRKLGAKI